MALLEVHDLHVSFQTTDGVVQAVRGVSFSVEPGQTLGIVGESGSGKSVSTQTIMGLTRGAQISGEALFNGKDLLTMTEAELRAVRGPQIAMIFQDPLSSLHPYYRVGLADRGDDPGPRATAPPRRRPGKRAIDLLRLVGIPQPDRRVDDFPHQFSGGMRQRAMIAMAMALNPALLIADEPTTALDVTVQAQVLRVIERLQEEFGTAVILITHDLGVIAEVADDVIVMYAGRVMEAAARDPLFYGSHHPYTEGLLRSLPGLRGGAGPAAADRRPAAEPDQPAPGCPFHPRCPYVMDRCRTEVPPLEPVDGDPRHTLGLLASAHEARAGCHPGRVTGEPVAS